MKDKNFVPLIVLAIAIAVLTSAFYSTRISTFLGIDVFLGLLFIIMIVGSIIEEIKK